MSSLWQFSILGVIQGLTEFLPISSSGHLALLSNLFGINEGSLEITILLHLATLCAVFFFVRKEILYAFKSPRIIFLVLAATIPTGIIGIFLSEVVKNIFQNEPKFVFVFLFVTGIILYVASAKKIARIIEEYGKITFLKAFLIGIAQGIAVLPGVSRSGATISTGIFCGIAPKTAAKFSFLLSIPAIAGASIVELKDFNIFSLRVYPASHLIIGMFLAFLSALLGLWMLARILAKDYGKNFRYFAYYLWIVSIVGLAAF